MPGLLSTIFADDGQPQEASGDAHSTSLAIADDTHLSPEIALHHEASGSHGNLDGSTTEWARSDELSVELDAHAAASIIGVSDNQGDVAS